MSSVSISLNLDNVNNNALLQWSINSIDLYEYRVFKRVIGSTYGDIVDEEFQSSTVFDKNEKINEVKVLNIHPDTSNTITYEKYDNSTVTIKETAILKKWIEDSNRNYKDGYNEGIFKITSITIEELNETPSLLRDNNGYWKYDIICLGFWNEDEENPSPELSQDVIDEMRLFHETGRGLLFSKNTIGGNYGTLYLGQLRDLFNIKVGKHDYAEDFDFEHGIKLEIEGDEAINIKNGFIINTPCKILNARPKIDIAYTKTISNFAYGDIWYNIIPNTDLDYPTLALLKDSIRIGAKFYLTTWNNAAMIQIGDVNNIADSEKSLIINTLAYLKQITRNKKAYDYSAQNIYPPTEVEITHITHTKDDSISIDYSCKEVGTKYEFYVEATNVNNNKVYRTKPREITIKNSDLTYIYDLVRIDKNTGLTTEIYTSGQTWKTALDFNDLDRGYYAFFVRVKDDNDNISDVAEAKFYVKGKNLSLDETSKPHIPNGVKFNNRYRGPQESYKTKAMYEQITKNILKLNRRLENLTQNTIINSNKEFQENVLYIESIERELDKMRGYEKVITNE